MQKTLQTLISLVQNKKDTQMVVISTFIIIVVNGLAMLYCHFADKNKDAQRYYKDFEPLKYYVIKFCYSIVAISFTFNLRYLIMNSIINAKKYMMTAVNNATKR